MVSTTNTPIPSVFAQNPDVRVLTKKAKKYELECLQNKINRKKEEIEELQSCIDYLSIKRVRDAALRKIDKGNISDDELQFKLNAIKQWNLKIRDYDIKRGLLDGANDKQKTLENKALREGMAPSQKELADLIQEYEETKKQYEQLKLSNQTGADDEINALTLDDINNKDLFLRNMRFVR